jgi:hypothetical protein
VKWNNITRNAGRRPVYCYKANVCIDTMHARNCFPLNFVTNRIENATHKKKVMGLNEHRFSCHENVFFMGTFFR